MSLHILAILGILVSGISASGQAETTQSLYGQCGGISYTGPSKCPKSATCYNDGTNPWYSQCVETPWDNGGGKPTSTVVTTTKTSKTTTKKTTATPKPTTTSKPTVTSKTSSATTTSESVTTIITTLPPRTTKTPGDKTTTLTLTPDDPFTEDRAQQDRRPSTDPTPAADHSPPSRSGKERRQSGPGDTLQAGWYWVRAVAAPNYHKYLQTRPSNAPGAAILESYRTAGQYKIADGQVVANTGAGGSPLYLQVEKPADFTQRTLATWFNTTANQFGAFAWQGDALTWSAPEVKRQNLAAWLVCANQALFINTGAYAYQTPAGCADQTIHYYNDAHANA
ncbi:hypothetical protein F4859DRAFT_135758 [Xylaria cf. heliscus]|nr:hypothetical protein F4859DRAFT_135758 [Xylaria cf. heliscus]